MKKNYIAPAIAALNTELEQLLSLSNGGTTDQTEGNLSRRHDTHSWDDEWDDIDDEE